MFEYEDARLRKANDDVGVISIPGFNEVIGTIQVAVYGDGRITVEASGLNGTAETHVSSLLQEID